MKKLKKILYIIDKKKRFARAKFSYVDEPELLIYLPSLSYALQRSSPTPPEE
jgi:hypothetical protein